MNLGDVIAGAVLTPTLNSSETRQGLVDLIESPEVTRAATGLAVQVGLIVGGLVLLGAYLGKRL